MAISTKRKKKYLPSEVVTNIFARLPLESIGNVMLVNKFCLKLISTSAFARAQTKMEIPYLPPEILTNIFTRLPIETLSNVLLVNKFCLKLITGSDFARAHLKHSKQGKTANLSDYKLISVPSYDGPEAKQFSLASLLFNSSSINAIDINYPKNRLCSPRVSFEGSCDGLVCLVLNDKYVFLWNPCTGKYKKLPSLQSRLGHRWKDVVLTIGLGYDESNDDFKVVALCTQLYESFPQDYEVYVFSLKRRSWKTISQDLKCNAPQFYAGKLICGKLHWLSGADNKNDTRKIVSFDVESEVFGIVEPPSNYKDGFCKMALDVLEGCICLLVSYEEEEPHVDLWVLKKYGVNASWTKVVTISCVGIPDCFRYYNATVLQNDEIFFHSGRSFAVYNPKESSFRFPGMRRLELCEFPSIFYVPSLVSPIV